MSDGSSTAHLDCPKPMAALLEGYRLVCFRRDVLAGLTGIAPERGLTALAGGCLTSALGGSRFRIGGPAGAFIVSVAATVAQSDLHRLLLTVLVSRPMPTQIGASGLQSGSGTTLQGARSKNGASSGTGTRT